MYNMNLVYINNSFLFTFIGFLAIWLVEQLVSFPMNFLNKSEALLSANMAGFWGFRNSAGSPETKTRADVMTIHSCTKFKYCQTDA